MSGAKNDWTIVSSRRWKVPQEHGVLLAQPNVGEMPRSVERNRAAIGNWDFEILGRPIHELRQFARREAIGAAVEFTQTLDGGGAEVMRDPSQGSLPLLVSGHQPELFHPGVWAKNFLLHRLAEETGGIGLNLIVDYDSIPVSQLALPAGGRDVPRLERMTVVDVVGNPPWEEVFVADSPHFRSLADRVTLALSEWSLPQPLLQDIWPDVCAWLARQETQPVRLADAFTVARRTAERRAGINNLELPVNRLAETESFAWFVAWLCHDSTRWHNEYNVAVEEYRRTNRIRTAGQPVPKLIRETNRDGIDRCELPLWVWRAGETKRRRLFVAESATELILFADADEIARLPHAARSSPDATVSGLLQFGRSGIKVRPRALTNTFFARVFLGETFLHGIGGAKYDEITDRLIVRLCGIGRPPDYLMVTATFRLPLGAWPVTSADVADLRHRLWDFDHSPDRFLTDNDWPISCRSEVAALLAERRRLIAEQCASRRDSQPSGSVTGRTGRSKTANFRRLRRLREIRRRLSDLAASLRQARVEELRIAEEQFAANAILGSREFAFCLFSADLPKQLADVIHRSFEEHGGSGRIGISEGSVA